MSNMIRAMDNAGIRSTHNTGSSIQISILKIHLYPCPRYASCMTVTWPKMRS